MTEEKVAEGVWLLRGDLRRGMNIYFLRDGNGVVQFDAGTKPMTKATVETAQRLGGLKQVVLSHAHADHRGTAPYMGVSVLCHPAEVADAESDDRFSPYMDTSELPFAPVRWIYPLLFQRWDGGPVKIAATISEGEELAGFQVLDFPGHAPGLIGLWRASDRVRDHQRRRLPDRLRAPQGPPPGPGQCPPSSLGLGSRNGEGVGAEAGRP